MGLDYIEGGWPGANPTDDKFLSLYLSQEIQKLLHLVVMRKHGKSAANDPNLNAVLN